jgi:TldD protein
MIRFFARPWGRRDWLVHNAQAVAHVAVTASTATLWPHIARVPYGSSVGAETAARAAAHAERLDFGPVEALARRAVEAAQAAGATYADTRLTRIVRHAYDMSGDGVFRIYDQLLGVGVRALVNGYWGFAASPFWESDEVVQLARDAVSQAKNNMLGTPRTVELGQIPIATGTWSTPIRIDPFTVPIEEKLDHIRYWKSEAEKKKLQFAAFGLRCGMNFARQERVVATSEGASFTQTLYESGGLIQLEPGGTGGGGGGLSVNVQRIEMAALGWERFLDAEIPAQFEQLAKDLEQQKKLATKAKPAEVGRYTIVCDGATMGALVNRTWGIATQLDRALGYEANATGTSILTEPLEMLGHLQVASPAVNITANRSAPAQLATVKWDDEGVEPVPFSLIRNGMLVDFQTTREQAAWLAPYYQRKQVPVRSHGCAAAENGLSITLQHMPNVVMEPSSTGGTLQDLVANVTDGLLLEHGRVMNDFQVSGGTLWGSMHEIKNGRVGRPVIGGAVYFNTLDLWKHATVIGNAATQVVHSETQYTADNTEVASYKGQPGQATSHSFSGVAATITNQPVIIPSKKR